MRYTSKKYFEENFKEEIWKGLARELNKAKSRKEIVKTLSKSLTSAELNLLEKRLAVLYLLKQKLPYRKISEIADVHYNTISFVKKDLQKPVRKKKVWSESKSSSKHRPKFSKFPTYKGKGRWRFLNM